MLATRRQLHEALREMNTIIDPNLNENIFRSGAIHDICIAALGVLFVCIMIKFLIECINGGYNFNVLKRAIFQMAILGVIISPTVFTALAQTTYVPLYTTMMEHIGNAQMGALRDATYNFFIDAFNDGDAGVKRLFGIFDIDIMPISMIIPIFCYILFIISVYVILSLPTFLVALTIMIAPLMLAFLPLFPDMTSKLMSMLFGLGVIFPVVLFGIGTFLPITMTVVSELLLTENMMLLAIICLAFSFVMAYSLPVIGFISGLSFVSNLRVVFPITWVEYIILKPVKFVITQNPNKRR